MNTDVVKESSTWHLPLKVPFGVTRLFSPRNLLRYSHAESVLPSYSTNRWQNPTE